jgi:hypothetical protein
VKRIAPGALAFAAAVAVTTQAAAQARGEMQSDLRGYYHGEQTAAYIIGGMGLAAAGGGAYLVTRRTDFSRGLGWTWVAMGGLEALGAAFYSLQVDGELDHYQPALARDPAAFRAEERDHLRGTESRFTYYRATELGLTLAGAGMLTYGLVAKRDTWTGVGLGGASLALPLFVIDSFNNARAHRYLDHVESFNPSVGASAGGLSLSLSGRF